MSFAEEIAAQYQRFDRMRDEIHAELVEAGIDQVIEANDVHRQSEVHPPYLSPVIIEAVESGNPALNFKRIYEEAYKPYEGRNIISRYVVSKSSVHTTRLADIDRDLDPLAPVIATVNEVGVATSLYDQDNPVPRSTSLQLLLVSEARVGESQEPEGIGVQLNFSQLAVVEGAIKRLREAKFSGDPPLRYLTKSLTKIDPAGD